MFGDNYEDTLDLEMGEGDGEVRLSSGEGERNVKETYVQYKCVNEEEQRNDSITRHYRWSLMKAMNQSDLTEHGDRLCRESGLRLRIWWSLADGDV